MAQAARTELSEPFAERVERLADELRLAIKWNRPSILLAVYQSRFVMLDAQAALAKDLDALGQRVERFVVDAKENADIPLLLSEQPDLAQTVFFIEGLQYGGTAALRALNFRREDFVERRIRVVFWLTEHEAVAIPREAPDFWRFRHRVVDFMERPESTHAAKMGRKLAWAGLDDHTWREDTDAKIALRLALLQDLPEGDETRAARAELQYTLAGLYWAKGEFDASIRYWQEAIRGAEQLGITQLLSWCYNGLGNVYRDLERTDDAIDAFQRAIQLDPQDAYPRNGLGAVYYILGRYDDAIAESQRAIQLDPKYAYPHNGLGKIYADLGRTDDAIAAYQRAIQIDPKYATPYSNLALSLRLLNRDMEAVPLLEKYVQLNPNDADPHLALASVHKKLGHIEQSAKFAAQARTLIKPDNWYNLACLESVCGNTDAAIENLRRAAKSESFPREWAQRDPDFEWIRDDARFKEIVAR